MKNLKFASCRADESMETFMSAEFEPQKIDIPPQPMPIRTQQDRDWEAEKIRLDFIKVARKACHQITRRLGLSRKESE
jgi:hypothetical protein